MVKLDLFFCCCCWKVNRFDLIWFDLFIVQVHKYDKKTAKTNKQTNKKKNKTKQKKKTRDSLVPDGFPRSELNHYLKGLRKPS